MDLKPIKLFHNANYSGISPPDTFQGLKTKITFCKHGLFFLNLILIISFFRLETSEIIRFPFFSVKIKKRLAKIFELYTFCTVCFQSVKLN